ncbi:alkene reductase [Desulfoluna spongiiphila]|uniref:alkene reductase n=1 Tax=Desulfoluna spongiiphila TaxID=419481 RepID=UPI001255B952|nr:alkene reductase [Desulfoluna spongiiphila]VVS93526.1 aldolase-type tim barrel [Desulfoluna spongiiphila]
MSREMLFSPFHIGPLTLPNRVVMAPLTRSRAGEGNVPHALNVEYYAQRATAGLIISEATQISPQGVGYPWTPGIHSPEQVAGWSQVTGAVHNKGGRIYLQLWHVGRISHPSLQPNGEKPVAPSALVPAGESFTPTGMAPFETPRELGVEEIPCIVAQYAAAAENAMAAGFDGVEIHGANGYLIDQFLRDGTNRRTDAYGGNIGNRGRFLKEVTEAILKVVEPGRVGVRLSPENTFNDIRDSEPQATFEAVAEMLSFYRLAYLHVVEGDFVSGEKRLDYSRIKERFRGPYMANAGYTKDRAEQSLRRGETDLVSFGALYIANPDLVARFEQDAPLAEPDEATYYGGGEEGYTDYPALEE